MAGIFAAIPQIDFMLTHTATSVEMYAVQDSGGRPVFDAAVVGVSCFFEQATLRHEERNGNVVLTRATFYFNGDLVWTTRSKIIFSKVLYEVIIANPVYGPGDAEKPHHWELHCK